MRTVVPMPLRAAAGLAAVAIDETRKLPHRAATLPVVAVSVAMQTSLKVQQRYNDLAVRGDQLLAALGSDSGQNGDEAPPWATFDEDEPPTEPGGPPLDEYDEMSIPSLRARLRRLSADDLAELLHYERTHENRAPYVTMLENRLAAVRN